MSDEIEDGTLYEGFASRCLKLTAKEGMVYVTLNVKELKFASLEGDESVAMIAAGLFKTILKPHYNVHEVDLEDVVVCFEVPEIAFRDEVQVTFEHNGMMFRVKDSEIEDDTNIIPRIVVNDSE